MQFFCSFVKTGHNCYENQNITTNALKMLVWLGCDYFSFLQYNLNLSKGVPFSLAKNSAVIPC